MVKIKKDFTVDFNHKTIMHLMDCKKDSPLYEEIMEEFRSLSKEAIKKINPIALMEFGEIPQEIATKDIPIGTKALYCLLSIGNELSQLSSKFFKEGDSVAGFMLDIMADDILFQMDNIIKNEIITICRGKNIGIKKRLEAPVDIDMKAQKVIWEKTQAYKLAGVSIKESYMFDPVKTIGQIYIIDECNKQYKVDHNCDNCSSNNCKFKNMSPKKATVIQQDKKTEFLLKENQSIMEAMISHHIYTPAICGGRGTCGKCDIYVIKGEVPISNSDKKFFSKEELERGRRLSCTAYPISDCVISLNVEEDSFDIVTDYKKDKTVSINKKSLAYKVIVDIGTTTIAMQLIDGFTGDIYDTYTTINRQRVYGADVISRIKAANEGKEEELKKNIEINLLEGLEYLVNNNVKPSEMYVVGNTTMIHLLMGYPCNTLGVYPFDAYNLNKIETKWNNLKFTVLPGISTFVGADITAGIFACDIDSSEEIKVLIDLGTNGEMAIGNKDKIFVTATAAGPAFEGGNITFGTGSIKGAIYNIALNKGKIAAINTIGNSSPIGICGTGVVAITAELLKEDIIDETGLLDEDYFEDGFFLADSYKGEKIYFTQKDIREIQLAKSAIRAGLETLIKRYKVSYKDISKVYLAGGFGYKMDIDKAIAIGMFPKELKNVIEPVGNSALSGCLKYAIDNEQRDRVEKICSLSKEINLSRDKYFNDLYMKHMMF